MLVLMPFAKHIPSGDEVFVDDVPSGLDCNCECLGCGVRVLARKGDVKVHHFAHKPTSAGEQVICPFNSERAIFWMCRKVLSESTEILFPSYILYLHRSHSSEVLKYNVTKETRVTLSNIIFPYALENTYREDEAILTVGKFNIALTLKYSQGFSYKNSGRRKPFLYHGEEIPHLIIEVDILIKVINEKKRGFRKILEELLVDGVDGKHWLYHPREDKPRVEFEQLEKEAEDKRKEEYQKKNAAKIAYNTSIRADRDRIEKLNKYRQTFQTDRKFTDIELRDRLEMLLKQADIFRSKNITNAFRCEHCYFLMKPDLHQCQLCKNRDFIAVKLDEAYFYCLKNKYECWGYPRRSIISMPNVTSSEVSDSI